LNNLIQIYTNSNPDLSKNGIIINSISCTISPKLNGENELEMEFAIDEYGLYKYIQNNNFIAVPTPDFEEPQLYRIYDTKKSMSTHTINAYARHIEFDLAKSVIFNKNVQGNGQQVLTKLLENTPFTGHSDITTTDIRQYKMRNVINVLVGSEDDSFLNIWGGEIQCNNYQLTFNNSIGFDKGIRVTFGYNLEDIEEDLNFDDVVTRLYPYSGDLVLSGNMPYVDSPLIQNIGVLEDKIEFSDIKVKENSDDTEGYATRADAEAEMVRRCNKLFEKGLDKITGNYVVKMQSLSKTREYKELGYDVLEKICLGDTVHCYNKNIGIEVEARCISYKWDCINEEYIEIELGDFINDYVNMQNDRLDNLYRKIQLTEQNILLQVTSLDNNLHTEISMTASQIRSEAEDSKNQLQTSITETASQIRSEAVDTKNSLEASITLTASAIRDEVSNADAGLNSKIEQQAGQIQSTVTKLNGAESQITQLANDISSKVDEGDFSSLIQQNAQSVAIAIRSETDMNVVFDSNGQTIKNGALKVVDSSNNTLMYFDDDKGILGTRELSISDVSKGSAFYNTLMKMNEVYFPNMGCGTLYVNDKSLEEIIYDMLVDYGLV